MKGLSYDGYRNMVLALGLSEYQYGYLRYMVCLQNQMVSDPKKFYPKEVNRLKTKNGKTYDEWKTYMEKGLHKKLTDAEFEALIAKQFDSFCAKQPDGTYRGRTDFAHMMYTIAAGCADEHAKGLDNSYPNFPVTVMSGTFWWNSDMRKQYTGWLGDATWAGQEGRATSFGPDDYPADLDADNILRRMEKGNISYLRASKEYYEALDKNPKLRAREFKQNNPYKDVEKEVLKRADVRNMDQLKKKEGWSTTYDFLKSLKNDDPDIQPYHDR